MEKTHRSDASLIDFEGDAHISSWNFTCNAATNQTIQNLKRKLTLGFSMKSLLLATKTLCIKTCTYLIKYITINY